MLSFITDVKKDWIVFSHSEPKIMSQIVGKKRTYQIPYLLYLIDQTQ